MSEDKTTPEDDAKAVKKQVDDLRAELQKLGVLKENVLRQTQQKLSQARAKMAELEAEIARLRQEMDNLCKRGSGVIR